MSIGSALQKAGKSFGSSLEKTGNSLVDAGKGALEDIADAAGLGKLLRGGPSSDPLKADFASASIKEDEGNDWRVKLSIPKIITNKDNKAFAPLNKTGGLCFPYTPTILMSHSANYNTLQPVHTNYPFQIYENSQADDIVITGEFPVESPDDAKYWIGAIHYLRTVTKMFYGETSANAGSPPPMVRLNGYGDYIFNNVPVVIANFTVDLPADVDYIATALEGADIEGATSWVPTNSQISVTLKPTFSRRRTSEFNLQKFVNGDYISGSEGFI